MTREDAREWVRTQVLEDPDTWEYEYEGDDLFIFPKFKGEIAQCLEVAQGPVRCELDYGHEGAHSAEYFHLGGLYCQMVWERVK